MCSWTRAGQEQLIIPGTSQARGPNYQRIHIPIHFMGRAHVSLELRMISDGSSCRAAPSPSPLLLDSLMLCSAPVLLAFQKDPLFEAAFDCLDEDDRKTFAEVTEVTQGAFARVGHGAGFACAFSSAMTHRLDSLPPWGCPGRGVRTWLKGPD
jgi:hypothetical protein